MENKAKDVALNPGEIYVGVVLKDGRPDQAHHLILLPGDADEITWDKARAWATEQGGELPTREEALLLFRTQREQFKDDDYWTSEAYAGDDAYAWIQYVYDGCQGYWHKASELRARAVRREAV